MSIRDRQAYVAGRRPLALYLVYGTVMSLVVGGTSISVGPTSVLGLATILTVVAALFALVSRAKVLLVSWPLLLGLLFVSYAILSLVVQPGAATEGAQNIASYGCFFFTALLMSNVTIDREAIFEDLRRISLLISLVYFAQLLVLGSPEENTGFPMGARVFAAYTVVAICLPRSRSDDFLSDAVRWTRPWFQLVLVVASLSRSAMVIAGVCASLRFSIKNGRLRVLRLAAILGGLTVTLPGLLSSVAQLQSRFFTGDVSLTVAGVTVNGEGRAKLWQTTIASFAHSPVLGNGAGNAEALITAKYGEVGHPHNEYLRLLNDYGVLGSSLFLGSLLLLFLELIRRMRNSQSQADSDTCTSAVLALLGVSALAVTDNVFVYAFVTAPLGVIVGVALNSQTPAR